MAGTTASELQSAIKSMAVGMFKGNTADTLGAPVDLVNTAIKPITERLGIATDTPFGGSAHFRTLFGMDTADKNAAETAGSMISAGGAAKAMIIGAARLGKAVDVEKATELVTKHPEVRPSSVYNMTGVYKGEDDKLRAVISDQEALIKRLPESSKETMKLTDVLDHPELFKLYPELENTKVIADLNTRSGNAAFIGGAGRGDSVIKLSFADAATVNANKKYPNSQSLEKSEKVLGTILHEVQHNVQKIEGFARGGSPAQFLPPNIDSQAKAVQAAVIRGRESADPSVKEAAERFKARFNNKIQDAHINYENIPGEQEARYTQQMMDASPERLAANVRNQLKAGVTPQTWDTQPLPSVIARENASKLPKALAENPQGWGSTNDSTIPKGAPAGTVAPPAAQEANVLNTIKNLIGR